METASPALELDQLLANIERNDATQERLRKLSGLPDASEAGQDPSDEWNSFNSFEAFERWR